MGAELSAALLLADFVMGKVEEAFQKGLIPKEEQQAARDKYNEFVKRNTARFQGPQWEETTD